LYYNMLELWQGDPSYTNTGEIAGATVAISVTFLEWKMGLTYVIYIIRRGTEQYLIRLLTWTKMS